MRYILTLIGLTLIIAAAMIMVITLSVDRYDFSANIVAAYLCEPNESIIVERRTIAQATVNFTTFYYCEDSEGQRRDITARYGLASTLGFLIPFGFGMPILMLGVWLNRRARRKAMTSNLGVYNLSGGATVKMSNSNLSPTQQAQVEQVLLSVGNAFGTAESPNTLADRLKQLQDAYEQGLISSEEYEQTRQAIINSTTDR